MRKQNQHAIDVITAFGGTSKLAKLMGANTSTVHNWREHGIPPSRMKHIRLLAVALDTELPKGE